MVIKSIDSELYNQIKIMRRIIKSLNNRLYD